MKTTLTTHLDEIVIKKDISLREKNWFRTGGAAKFFASPQTVEEFGLILRYAQERQLQTFTFGDGANLLVHDDGFDGIAIRPELTKIEFEKVEDGIFHLHAGAGVKIDTLIQTCLNQGFFGLEDFSGIPGTIGGAVFINLHYFGSMISHSFVKGEMIDRQTGNIYTTTADEFKFGYNESVLHEGKAYLTSATFKVYKAAPFEVAYHQGRRDEIIRHRRSRYPRERTCGSFFRNFHETELASGNSKATHPYIAYYLDKLGVKGSLRQNGAVVSRHHANMIVTDRPDATTADIVALACKMQQMVLEEFGLLARLECQLLGFKESPFEPKMDRPYTCRPSLSQIQRTADGL